MRDVLGRLQDAVRSDAGPDEDGWRSGTVPADLRARGHEWLAVSGALSRRIDEVVVALRADNHYEHLGAEADKTVWDFVCRAAIEPTKNHVPGFAAKHRLEPFSVKIGYGIEYLTASEPFSVNEIRILPLPDESTEAGRRLRQDAACGAMAEMTVEGTEYSRMIERGRARIEFALQMLRVCLANLDLLSDIQLRFRTGRFYVLDDANYGFRRQPDAPLRLEVPAKLEDLSPAFQLLPLTFDGNETEIRRQAKLAVVWISESSLTANLTHKVAFLFSALEAMLGSKAEGLKAPSLVYYRMMLGEVVTGGFPDPNRLYWMYDEIRSSAVHGELVAEISSDDVRSLEWSVRRALFELVQFADEHKLVSRSAVRRALRDSQNARRGLDYLKARSRSGGGATGRRGRGRTRADVSESWSQKSIASRAKSTACSAPWPNGTRLRPQSRLQRRATPEAEACYTRSSLVMTWPSK